MEEGPGDAGAALLGFHSANGAEEVRLAPPDPVSPFGTQDTRAISHGNCGASDPPRRESTESPSKYLPLKQNPL